MTRSVITDLLKIFKASYAAVLPDKIIKKCISYDPKTEILSITGVKYDLSKKNVYVAGAGKAVQYMAKEIDAILSFKIEKGILSIPAKSQLSSEVKSNLIYCEGAQDNLPDDAATTTAMKIKDLALSLTANDFLLVLLSGGGSALLPLPKAPITLNEKLELVKKLAKAGADINELNIVRKKISDIKGGKLALAAYPAQVATIIISDVINDPLDIIASGPTVEDTDDSEMAIAILKKYGLQETLHDSIKTILECRTKPELFLKEMSHNYLIASNKTSIWAAHDEALQHNYEPIIISRAVFGNINDIAKEYVKLAKYFSDYLTCIIKNVTLKSQLTNLNIPGIEAELTERIDKFQEPIDKPLCLILGGESTVVVKGKGKGGRNQQLALEFSNCIHQIKDDFKGCNVYMLSAGTDGIDGPTDAAGAIGYLDLISDSEKADIDVHNVLENNDAYNFYKKFKDGSMHVVTGHTNTNVMDIHLIVIKNHDREI